MPTNSRWNLIRAFKGQIIISPYTAVLTGRQYDVPDPTIDPEPDTSVTIRLGESERR